MQRLISILFLALYVCVSVFATNAESVVDQIDLDELTITARVREKDVILPQTLSGDELHQLSALNVADALRYFTGVQIRDYGGVGGIKTVNVRSMGSQHVGVYYNGIQLGNAQNGVVDLGKFSMEELEEIQLYHGQKSDIFQSAREMGCAGSVYLQSRKPHFINNERVHARVRMRCGSFALANPSMSVDINLLTKTKTQTETRHQLYLTLSGEFTYSDGQYPFRYRKVTPSGAVAYDTTATRHNGDIRAVRAEAALHHYYSTTGFWRLQGYTYWSERGIPGAIVNNVWSSGERMTDRNSFVQGQWQDEFFRRWSLRLLAKYANDYTHYHNLDERTLSADNTYLQQEVYLSLVQKVQIFTCWDMSVAYDMQYNDLNRQQGEHADKEYFSRWSHWLSLATAVNVQDYLRVQTSALMTHVDGSTRFTPAIFLSCSPLAGLSSPYAKGFKINAFYKQSYRYPTFNDLYYTEMGSTALKPELARQHDVGISYSFDSKLSTLNFQLDYYYNRVSDKIIAFPKGQQFRWAMMNLGEVTIHGVDAAVGTTLHLPLRFTLTPHLQYTYQRAIDVTNPHDSYYRHQIPYIPLHSGSAVVGLSYDSRRGDHYGLNYSFTYVGERYSQPENIPANYAPAWYTHDLTFFGEWGIRQHRLHAQLEINNLLGQDYEVIANYPMPKQNVRFSVSVTY